MHVNLKLCVTAICFQFLIAAWHSTASARLPKNIDSMDAQDVYELAIKSHESKDYTDASNLYHWAESLAKKQLGEDHELVEKAITAGREVRISRAEVELARAKAEYGESHPKVAKAYDELSQSWRNIGDKRKAIEHLESAIAIAEQFYESSEYVLRNYHMSVGISWRDLNEHEKALNAYDIAIQNDIDSFNSHVLGQAVIHYNYGVSWAGLNEHTKALHYYESAWANIWEYYEADYVDDEFAVKIKKLLQETKQKLGK